MTGIDVAQVSLTRLSRSETAQLVRSVAGDASITDRQVEEIVHRTDGVPLYAEELTRAVLEGGGSDQRIPDTLQDSLMARLDRLPSAKDVAQLAATVGRNFSLDLLAVASQQPVVKLRASLSELVASGLVYDGGGSDFVFKHALVRDVAYESLLRRTRRAAHARLAAHLEEPDLVAQHQAAAGLFAEAVPTYRRAASSAVAGWAYVEANAYLRAALECLDKATPGEDSRPVRQELLVDLGAGLRVIEDFEEAIAVLQQAVALGLLEDDGRRLSQAHYLMGGACFTLGRIDGCMSAHSEARRYAELAGSVQHQVQALSGIGDALYAKGHMRDYFSALDRCIMLAGSDPELTPVVIANLAPRGMARTYMAEFEEAVRDADDGAARAREAGNLRVEMIAHTTAGPLAGYELGRFADMEARLDRSQHLADQIGGRMWHAGATMMRAMGRDANGDADAVEQARRAVDAVARHGTFFFGCWSHAVLAHATQDPVERSESLAAGQAILDAGSISHDCLWFRRLAIEANLKAGDWDAADELASALESYTAEQPLPWSNAILRMARTLAAHGRGEGDRRDLRTLRDELAADNWVTLTRFADDLVAGRWTPPG